MARSRLDADLLAAACERDARRLLVFSTRRRCPSPQAGSLPLVVSPLPAPPGAAPPRRAPPAPPRAAPRGP